MPYPPDERLHSHSGAPNPAADRPVIPRPHGASGRTDGARLAVSLIIPAYNESVRLPPYLDDIRTHFDRHYRDDYEVIVVDDGSSDHLDKVLQQDYAAWQQLRVIRHPQNSGKGAAVRTGVLVAAGRYLLYADADGATPIREERKLAAALESGADLAVGSRLLAAEDVVRQRTWSRAVIGRTFAMLARTLIAVPVRDTQCGFKMLRAKAGKQLFQLSQETGYLFDLEILALAQRLGYRVAEIPIDWSDQPGSQLQLRRDGRRVLADLWRLRRHLKQRSLDYDKKTVARKTKTSQI